MLKISVRHSRVGWTNTTLACPEPFGVAQESLVEGRCAWWRFRHFGSYAKSVSVSDYVLCAGNTNSRCRSNWLISVYKAA